MATLLDRHGQNTESAPALHACMGQEDDSSSDYDSELDVPEDLNSPFRIEIGQKAYLKACETLKVIPVSRVLHSLPTDTIQLRYLNIGPLGGEALAQGVRRNTTVETLNLEETGLHADGACSILSMLTENDYIANLNMSNNFIGGGKVQPGWENLAVNVGLTHLDISSNNLSDEDSEVMAYGIQHNIKLVFLNLSRNSFTSIAAKHFGRALRENSTIEHLDLSWNQFRATGAVTLCSGIQHNISISRLNLSWVGLSYGGCLAVSKMLKTNETLVELDISNNSINGDASNLISDGLRRSRTLRVVKIGHNPLTMSGCLHLISAAHSQRSVLCLLNLDGVPVNRKVVYIAVSLQKIRPFQLTHGKLVESEQISENLNESRSDPLKLLVQFLSDKGIRPIELFRTFKKHEHTLVSKQQFIRGLKRANVPLDQYELERVSDRLCSANSGTLTYPLLVEGFKQQLLINREEEKKKQEDEKRNAAEHKRIMLPQLPPIEEMTKLVSGRCSNTSSSRLSSNQYAAISRVSSVVSSAVSADNVGGRRPASVTNTISSIVSCAQTQPRVLPPVPVPVNAGFSTPNANVVNMSSPLTRKDNTNCGQTVSRKDKMKRKRTKRGK